MSFERKYRIDFCLPECCKPVAADDIQKTDVEQDDSLRGAQRVSQLNEAVFVVIRDGFRKDRRKRKFFFRTVMLSKIGV